MKTLSYVELSDFPSYSDEIYELLTCGDLDIDLSPSRETLLNNTDLDELRHNPGYGPFFEAIDDLKKTTPDFKIMVHG